MNFTGFEDDRYAVHDDLIETLVYRVNTNKAAFIGTTEAQAEGIADVNSELVKTWMIQESGGGDQRSRAAWAIDPLQVNVPGDWSRYKESLGLVRPVRRNEGTPELNIGAAIGWLARKGFGVSGQPPGNRPAAYFDGWEIALRRYNGRTVRTENGQPYRVNYARRILERAGNPDIRTPIALPKPVTA